MMGPSHALSGAAAWLVGSLVLDQTGVLHQGPLQLAVGTAMCAGGALLPDMDLSGRVTTNQGGATVAHTFGVVSLFAAEFLEKVCLGVYNATRGSKDPQRHNGHRTLTHTILFNVVAGFLTAELCIRYGRWAVVTVLFLTFAMALRGLFEDWAKRAGWIVVTLVAAFSAYGAYQYLPADRGYPVLGMALGAGGLVHLLGDMLTDRGCPLFWPVPLGRKLWRCIGVPNFMAVKVGGKVEVMVLRTAFAVIAIASAGWLMWSTLVNQYHINELWAASIH
jgi:membrane-bound metal-dependent hydrolase YbcI (DUF457 family)